MAEIKREVVDDFMAGKSDGRCPWCGQYTEAVDSDEGPGDSHWLERSYMCECGCAFTEQFMCQPLSIWVDGEKSKEAA